MILSHGYTEKRGNLIAKHISYLKTMYIKVNGTEIKSSTMIQTNAQQGREMGGEARSIERSSQWINSIAQYYTFHTGIKTAEIRSFAASSSAIHLPHVSTRCRHLHCRYQHCHHQRKTRELLLRRPTPTYFLTLLRL